MKDIGLFTFGLFILYFSVGTVKSSHFGGAIFTWAPARDGSNITITFRIAWAISHATCDDTTVANETLIGSDTMSCFSGCTGTIGSLAFRCTDFRAGEWSSGGNNLVITTGVNQLSFGFSGGGWVSLQEAGSNWYLKATVELSVRTDIGRINSSPTADAPPVLYWQKDCTYSYTLAVNDVDDDVIRCRWATPNGINGDECGDVCSAFSGLVVNESTCTISNSASKNVGYYAVALQIEDFADESSTTPLSSIPLQFLVYIYSGTGCPDSPKLILPTPVSDKQYVLDKGDTLSLAIKARGPTPVVTMTAVTRLFEVTSMESSWYYITLTATWTPSDSDVGQTQRICFYARDTVGVTSDTRCITIVVSGHDNDNCNPEPCQNGGTCSDGLGDFSCACLPAYTGKNCSIVNSSHFGGGIFTWTPASDGSSINITFRIAWEIGSAVCDDTTVANETLIGPDSMTCFSGCTGTIGSLAFKCTDYKVGEWSSGRNSLVKTTGVDQLSFGTSSCCWINLQDVNNSYWYLKATADLSVRPDTGRINTSPTADMPPVLYWQKDCTYSYTLAVNDVDSDVIRCRWATPTGTNGDECAGVCSAFSGLVVNESACTITNSASKNVGYYAVALQIEDFADESSATPLSSIPLQFLVYIYSGTGCPDPPQLVSPTPAPDTQYMVDTEGTLSLIIKARGPNTVVTMTTVTRVSEVTSVESSWNYITLTATWTPTDSDVGQTHRICFYARDTVGVTSDTSCITIVVTDIGDCLPDPCENNGTCSNEISDYTCTCLPGYTDKNCSTDINECLATLCENGGTCTDEINDYTCTCVPGFTGKNCSTNIDECTDDPCENYGTCTDGINDFTCTCVPGYTDKNCSTNIDDCIPDPCENGGTCTDGINNFTCTCVPGYTDTNCSTNIDDCIENPCDNGGNCTDGINNFTCSCVPGYTGKNCSTDIDECLAEPCENGAVCTDKINDYICACVPGYADKNCSTNIDECMGDPCENGGTCTDGLNDYTCTCVPGYTDKNCSTNIDECLANPCDNGGTCSDEINDYKCSCVPGYTDKNCSSNIDECIGDPCENFATCTDGINDYMCTCVPGYTGKNCSTDIDECIVDPCDNGATCTDEIDDYTCTCVPGYTGKNCSTNINECSADPCENGGTCNDEINVYTCMCVPGYTDKNCSANIDECMAAPCDNGGTCIDGINDYTCTCVPGYTDKNCSTNIDECIDDPCENDGTCVDEVNDYRCMCVPGYTNKNCSTNIDECMAAPCDNDGTCIDKINDYTCTCVPGYTDKNCSTNIDECIDDPCENDGTCVDEVSDYRCMCVPGYTNKNCSTNIDECMAAPCDNDGTCIDEINDYTCTCVPGYTDKNCSTNIDECINDPCENDGTCVDEVIDYRCMCVPGYTNKNCSTNIDECIDDPCENDGTCVDEVNDYRCMCVPGYTDENCSTNIDECLANPCENGGNCTDGVHDFTCSCVPGFTDKNCSTNMDECRVDPCKNDGTCTDKINDYTCICVPGFTDKNCSTNINECEPMPCQNDGTCIDLVNGFECECSDGFTGESCRPGKLEDDCKARVEVCANIPNAKCNGSICQCVDGYQTLVNNETCSPVDCLRAPTLNHGKIVLQNDNDTKYGAVGNVSCVEGFVPSIPTVLCQANGTWPVPTCVRKKCPTIFAPEEGKIISSNGSSFGSVITFRCNTGYFLVGNESILCNSTGQWNTDLPLCKKKVTIGSKCENSNFCQTPRARCINSTCTCYTGIYNVPADVCDAMFLYKYGEEAGDAVLKNVDDSCSPPIRFSHGIPIFDSAHKTLYVCTNGLISFNQTYFSPIPYNNTHQYGGRTIVAPFFADTDTKNAGSVHYRYFDILTHAAMSGNEDIKKVQLMIEKLGNVSEFNAKIILFATWHRVTPFQRIFTNGTEATFQAVLASNGTDTYTLFIYGYNSMLWNMKVTLKPSLDIWIGYTASKKYTWSNINSFKLTALKMDSVAETKGISGILFNRLTPIGGQPLNAAIQCLDWYNKNKDSKPEFTTVSNELPDCPCNLESLSFDPWFWPKESSVTQASSMYTVEILPSELFERRGKSCTFNKTTGLWIDEFPSAGGFYINHQNISPTEHVRQDIDPKEVCCEGSGLCNLYYDLHPIGKCYTETWFETGTSWGDPHFVTLDKKEFTFNGLGEYELIHLDTSGKEFALQARTSRPTKNDGTLSYATSFTAFAAKDHTNASFHVELNKAKDGPILYANSADLSVSFKKQSAFRYKSEENNIVVIRKNDTLFIFFPNIGISLNVTVGAEMLAISATVPKKYNSTTRGLLGNFDNDPENDFVYPNGTFLPGNISEKDVFYYGQSWQVDEERSVFLYSEGMKPKDFRNATYVPKFLEDTVKENQTKVEEAERLCGGLKNTQCVFDFIFTLKEDIAKNTRKRKEIADVVSFEIKKRVPTLEGCQVLNITKNEEVKCALKISDEETLKIKFIENNVEAKYEEKEKSVVYKQVTDTPIKISISVENKDNKTSPPFRLKVQMCTGCSDHGTCTDVIRSDPKETEDFKYWECKCEPQYEGLDCEHDFDGCTAGPCSLGRECETLSAVKQKELNKTHLCGDCPAGFIKKDEDKCEDIDECGDNPNLCEHTCVNTDGSFECTCNKGYRKNSRNSSLCDDINECDEALHNCTQECINTIGGFNCTCNVGFNFISANWTCETAVENVCETAGIDCRRTAGCTIDENSQPTCFCESGFELSENGTTCNDVNECDRNVCHQLCYNTHGGFECACHYGYMIQDGACEKCDYPFWGKNCLNECKCSGQGTLNCDPVHGCVCDEGWKGDTCDDDIDECEDKVDPCQDVRKECVNALGGYTCKCRRGFEERDGECIDTDECSSLVMNDCSQTCFNTVGGYTCGCLDGFTKYNGTFCQDIDECKLRKDDCEQRCGNFPGLYNCYCYFGYTINDDRKTCEKVSDPCKKELNLTCSHHCVTSRDSASCQCRRGYILAADKQSCLDVDECKGSLHECSTEAECINTDGSYLCKCPKGSKLENNGRTCFECDEFHYGENCTESCSCLNGYCDRISGCVCDPGWSGIDCDKDTDECAGDVCAEANTECINTPGNFMCRCQSGYWKNKGFCEDIDECSNVKMNNCDQNCTNTQGSYICRCETGFAFKDGKCLDLDECRGVSKCDHICDNTVGSFRCSCHEGFKLNLTDRQSCIPYSDCNEDDITSCRGKNADCRVVHGKFNCYCPKGFRSNINESCEDIPECSENPPRCSQNCKEAYGGFECSCKPGFYLLSDGISCQECENGKHGMECLTSCDCIAKNTKVCQPENGSCECISGWEGTTCEVDVNECNNPALNNCQKNSICMNTNGSFFCKCDIGYFKTGEGSCEQCDKRHYGKDCSHECTCELKNTDFCNNVNGSCTCKQGWEGQLCTVDINECEEIGDVCAEQNHTKCRNTKGSYKCDCLDSYSSQNQVCIDKDECLDGTAACLQECKNTVGGYVCECSLGYIGYWNTCEVCSGNRYGKNCTSPCVCNTTNSVNELQTCDTETGSCKCKPGWEGDTCERDINECHINGICASTENTVCINSPGSYNCDCKRSFTLNKGICVEKEETTTVQPPDGYTEIQLTVRFDISLPSGINLNSSSGYEAVSQMVYSSLYDFYNLPEEAILRINDIRSGSIEVDYSIVYPSEDTELGNNITYDSISLVEGRQIHFDGKPVSVTVLGPFSNESDVCEMYATIRGPCPTATECTEIDNKPICREIVVGDKFSLIIGIGVGTLFILLSALICVFFIRRLREKVQDNKEQIKHASRLHRDELFPARKQASQRESKITKRPVFPEMNEYVTYAPRQGQIRRNMIWNSSKSETFGFVNEDNLVPRLDPSVLLRNQLDPMDDEWQPDYDITIDYSI